jgi:hypothetical protein
VPYFLSRYDPDPLRYYLTDVAPETRDTEFSWEDFVERKNPVLSVTKEMSWWPRGAPLTGMANRMLSFAYKRFDRKVPEPASTRSSTTQARAALQEAGREPDLRGVRTTRRLAWNPITTTGTSPLVPVLVCQSIRIGPSLKWQRVREAPNKEHQVSSAYGIKSTLPLVLRSCI